MQLLPNNRNYIRNGVHLIRDKLRKSRHKQFRSKRWPLGGVYFLLLDWSIINGHIIHKTYHHGFQHRDSKSVLCAQLFNYCQKLRNQDLVQPDVYLHSAPAHKNNYIPSRSLAQLEKGRLDLALGHFPKLSNKRRRCALREQCCSSTRTTFFCSWCGVFLHCDICFMTYHTVEQL